MTYNANQPVTGRIDSMPELVAAMREVDQTYSKRELEDMVKIFRRTVAVALAQGKEICMHSFMNFHVKQNKDRVASFTGKPVEYKGKKTIGVSVSPVFRKEVQNIRETAYQGV